MQTWGAQREVEKPFELQANEAADELTVLIVAARAFGLRQTRLEEALIRARALLRKAATQGLSKRASGVKSKSEQI